jgi:hypothetical protein
LKQHYDIPASGEPILQPTNLSIKLIKIVWGNYVYIRSTSLGFSSHGPVKQEHRIHFWGKTFHRADSVTPVIRRPWGWWSPYAQALNQRGRMWYCLHFRSFTFGTNLDANMTTEKSAHTSDHRSNSVFSEWTPEVWGMAYPKTITPPATYCCFMNKF